MKDYITSILWILFLFFSANPAVSQDVFGPYDVRYKTTMPASVHQQMDLFSPITRYIPEETSGIALRWCLPEFQFGEFMRAGEVERHEMLSARICEAIISGKSYYISGQALTPER